MNAFCMPILDLHAEHTGRKCVLLCQFRQVTYPMERCLELLRGKLCREKVLEIAWQSIVLCYHVAMLLEILHGEASWRDQVERERL